VAQLRLRGIVASRETEDALLVLAERLFPAAWVVEIAGEGAGKQGTPVGIEVCVRDGSIDMGSHRFESNQLEHVPPFLERVAKLALGRRLTTRGRALL
jgi:hypothetical protein